LLYFLSGTFYSGKAPVSYFKKTYGSIILSHPAEHHDQQDNHSDYDKNSETHSGFKYAGHHRAGSHHKKAASKKKLN
jgi:hypothetical protein